MNGKIDGWIDGWLDGWQVRQIDGLMHGYIDVQINIVNREIG